ncbi:MAG TPA: polyphosphate kinase 2 family protein [Thermoplasmata archaeon]|nr:polyphosphate kinase 2 family protein [Thermoplasmata archaeon]
MGFDDLRLSPGADVRLSHLATDDTSGWPGGKGKAEAALPGLREELTRLQELFYADARRGLLVILQGMDTSGKDGVIRHVFEGVNPQGVRVSSFKQPTPEELSHDFLWRVHRDAPARGEIVIFNRSHYEDVLVARVHQLVPRSVWSKRFDAINAFERELSEEGDLVLKFFLHISRAEQARRLRDRIRDPTKRWKLSAADFHERRYWSKYQSAYEDVLVRTNTPWAPWYILPSDHKWFRNLAISSILVEQLRGLKLRYPEPRVPVSSLHLD